MSGERKQWRYLPARRVETLEAEVLRLRAEVESLTTEITHLWIPSAEEWMEDFNRLRAAGDALAACVNQFGDTDNWTHDDGFLFHDEALAAIAAWEEARRER